MQPNKETVFLFSRTANSTLGDEDLSMKWRQVEGVESREENRLLGNLYIYIRFLTLYYNQNQFPTPVCLFFDLTFPTVLADLFPTVQFYAYLDESGETKPNVKYHNKSELEKDSESYRKFGLFIISSQLEHSKLNADYYLLPFTGQGSKLRPTGVLYFQPWTDSSSDLTWLATNSKRTMFEWNLSLYLDKVMYHNQVTRKQIFTHSLKMDGEETWSAALATSIIKDYLLTVGIPTSETNIRRFESSLSH